MRERERKERCERCFVKLRNLGVRKQQSCRPPPDRRQSVMGMIDEGAFFSPPSVLHHSSNNQKKQGDRCRWQVSHPFTSVIECVILPLKLRYFFVGCLWEQERKNEYMWSRSGNMASLLLQHICERQAVDISARTPNEGRCWICEGCTHAVLSALED